MTLGLKLGLCRGKSSRSKEAVENQQLSPVAAVFAEANKRLKLAAGQLAEQRPSLASLGPRRYLLPRRRRSCATYRYCAELSRTLKSPLCVVAPRNNDL